MKRSKSREASKRIAYLNIGSNLGDTRANIEKAIDKIGEIFYPYCLSGFVDSEPWGFESSNPFLNIGMSFKTSIEPEELLAILKRIETTLSSGSHRDSEGQYCDREIDIDIMAIEGIRWHSERLVLPHVHLLEREFFLKPLLELNPEWHYPLETERGK